MLNRLSINFLNNWSAGWEVRDALVRSTNLSINKLIAITSLRPGRRSGFLRWYEGRETCVGPPSGNLRIEEGEGTISNWGDCYGVSLTLALQTPCNDVNILKNFIDTARGVIKSLVKIAGFACLCMLSIVIQAEAQQHEGKKIVLQLNASPENPRNSEGSFITLKDGRLLFVYTHFTAGAGDHAKAHLAGRYSSDGGKTWTSEDVVILPNEGDMNIMSVSLLRMPDDGIAMFYLRKNSMEDCIPVLRKSYDEAQTWSEPIEVITDKKGYFVMNNDRVIQLENGRWLAPVSIHQSPGIAWHNTGNIFCYYSDDQGSTWQSSAEVPNPEGVMLQEPGVIALKNGKIMMFIRTDAGVQYLSYSEDDGETWSTVAPSNINSPRAPASVKRIPSTDDLLLVWNNNRGEKEKRTDNRTHYNTAISKDEGKTWQHIQTVASKPNGLYCYYAIAFVEDAVLLGHIAEWNADKSGLSTHITRLDLHWLYENKK